ncbi:hypothetical protein JTE90_009334 [Oedothorax gibbosus]|uniref:Hemolectin n=1 Tax=Oedothorax gibbosus TaxID=931172 RepID=A0AAV6VUN7_9ARAC|nr:hypothetical protein JTE90_009334 [Oedothorax gibbosus]
MLPVNFGSLQLWAIVCVVLFHGCLRLAHSDNQHEEESDDLASMGAHEFDDLHMCEEPPPPMNGDLLCSKHKTRKNRYVCKAECEKGFQFPDGKRKGRHLCDLKSGKWSPSFIFPDCIPVCNPPCNNNGECTEGNHCICTPDYRGERCQYDLALCDPEKGLGVSGDWSCNHTSTTTQCILNCLPGTKYETQPADQYTCTLEGVWTPNFAPKCTPMNVIEGPGKSMPYSFLSVTQSTSPSSGVCATWGTSHYRTFDGGLYTFKGGSCPYLFAKDCEQNTFSIHVQNGEPCQHATSCKSYVSIYVGTEEYLLSNGLDGPTVENEGETYVVPAAVDGLLFQMVSDYVTLESPLGFRLKWNRRNTLLLEITGILRNKTCGLCGKFDGSVINDFETSDGTITDSVEVFANSWAMNHLGETCDSKAVVSDTCGEKREKVYEAQLHCKIIFSARFSSCHSLVDPHNYFEACKFDYCGCGFSDNYSCSCDSLAEYFRECSRLGGKVEGGWRSENLCPLSCPEGMLYSDCGSSCPRTCRGTVYDCEDSRCVDGCHCPEGRVLHEGRCVERASCPCMHNGREHQSGERMLQDCNACECNGGKWKCTEETCGARCSSTGDPHYTTFDGLNYEFLGSCLYYLVFNDNFTIVQETGPCSSASAEPSAEAMYCTQAIRVEIGENTLLLQKGIKVTLNDKLKDLPLTESGFSASMVTDSFVKVRLDNGISLLWDGHNRIYIDAPPTLLGQTAGLCGTFNHNQNDDFLTPERDVEADVDAFAARWQASDACRKRSRRSARWVEMQPQKIAESEMLCSVLRSGTFSACHGEVDLEPFYKSCVNDMCLCGSKIEECLCPILSDYSLSCTRKGIILNWVEDIPSCKPECSGGQIYRECGNPCTCSCEAIALGEDCTAQCVQGCTCPDGMTMNNEGFCIPIDQCPCWYDGKAYAASDITVQSTNICTCENAKWQCRSGKSEELKILNPDINSQENSIEIGECSHENNEEFTDCVETCPQTCQNAHLPPKCNTEECKPGCRCKEGFILDADLKKCVDIQNCGCIHASKKYSEGDTMKQSCNLCTCKSGEWQCTEKVCPGICTAWGESHFKSFDGKIFDFQGDCEYILTKGKTKETSFSLSIQNVPCGTSGVTCSKSFTVDLGPVKTGRGDLLEVTASEEKLTVTRGYPLPKMSLGSRFVLLESGLFVLVYTDVGVTVRWDKGTRIYVTLDPRWRNRVKGLCGNFNDDQSDDFLTPFGGIPEAMPSIFADSWKVQEFCPQPHVVEDTCAMHPHRKGWAQQKCGILKSDIFAECRHVVAVDVFYEKCVFDTCACDMGGDCECLCTAVAAYAQECNMHGVPIKWRSQEFCPIQCEECSTYDSCIPSCPKKTCENEYRYSKFHEACSEDFCVEGCNPKPCPEGQIYNNEKEFKCIPKVDCVVPCLEVNGVIYNEGDRITDLEVADPCQSCHCQRGSVNCIGNPCVKTEPIRPCIQTGWTPWMNTPYVVGGDYEELTNPLLKATYENFCGITNMTDIQCRVSGTNEPVFGTGGNIVCELPVGLTCRDEDSRKREICEDYEIRVFCDCGRIRLLEEIALPTTAAPSTLPPICEETGWTPWMSAHLPDSEGESETLDMLRINHYFCAEHDILDIECRTSLTWKYVLPESKDALCNKKLGLVCNGPHCQDHEIRVYCKCGKEETSPPPIPSCVNGWTEYYNTDHPDHSETGDEESLERIRESHQVCNGGTIEDIECKTVVGDKMVDYSELDNFGLKCSKNVGFICNKYVRTDKCPDFMVRFYCVCETTPENIVQTTTLPAPTTTELPVTSVPVECGWTPWLNIDTPETDENDDGDIEDLAKIQYLYKTCGGKDLIDIECRMSRTLHSYTESLQKNLQCDTLHGFRCHNSDQIGKCYDYEIRLLCMYDWCYPPTTVPAPTTKAPTTTENPCPSGQIYDECAYNCEQMCFSFVHEMSEKCGSAKDGCIAGCRPESGCLSPNVWRDYYTCVSKDECTCLYTGGDELTVMAPNEIIVRGCEKCQCVHDEVNCFIIPGCGKPKPPKPRTMIIDILKEDCWTQWINVDNPKSGGGDLEVLNDIRGMYQFCPDPVKIECRTVESKQKPFDVGQTVTCDLEKGLVCWNNDNKPEDCYDYEIRFYCPCPTTPPPTTTTPLPTLPPGDCIFGWTEWFNSHHPDYRGDHETVQSARSHHVFCANDMVSAIECRRAGTAEVGSLQRGVHCDLEVGLVCSQEYLGESEECWDYEMRLFCDCPTMAPITETETLPPTTTPLPARLPCSYWSDWINENHPGSKGPSTKSVKGGSTIVRNDNEKAMPLKLQREKHFCLEGTITDIECREADSDIDYSEIGENLVCSLVSGFRCRGKDQPGRICKDYKIRYYCSCDETSSTPVLTRPTTPVVSIEPCTTYYSIIDGDYPLPDSSIKTSSSKNAKSGPQSARLSAVSSSQSAGAWISGDISDHEFIEIDLGSIQPVYGIVTKGRNGHPEWVKSYKVLFSRNGMTYAYVSEKGNQDKIFSGNSDSDSRVEHFFTKPFEARFVRVQPLTFHKEIAMRVDLLGCADGMTTVPVYTTQPPPCTDDMGLVNGAIGDFQIKTSSDKNENSAGRFVRLNTPQTENNSGGWVAAELDQNQFVQIDFIEHRVLTGVKIQGRDMVPQWVTAFTVSYSSDAVVWNDMMDYSGENKKIFSGNYDSHTISTIYFPHPIRTRYIRIIPISWNNWIAMRLEILGCYERYEELVKDKFHSTEKPMMLETCIDPMGFENHQLPDTLITVSSSESPDSDKSRIRLNTPSNDQGTGGWIPAMSDYKPIVIIDFYEERNLTGIITQGLEDMDKWVMSYYVLYSLDNITYEKAYDKETGNMVFAGNFDRNTPVLRLFSYLIQTRFLKVVIVDYHTGPALRMEVIGCFIPYAEVTPPVPLLITTTEFCVKTGPWISLSDPASQDYGDIEPIGEIISASGACSNPYEIQCRSAITGKDYTETGQSLLCDLEHGLKCLNREQSSYMCYNYEVRIKCWTCGIETTTAPLPLELCPEVPPSMKETCPMTCPVDYVCDGYNCVPRIDCPCFKEEKRVQPSNIIVTSDCKRCECILGGYSNCKTIECPVCLPGQKSQMNEHCECQCTGCADGTLLCPSSGECVSEDKWCDGIVDCPNDEVGCPTTVKATTTTVAPTTTEIPIYCSTDYGSETDTCEINANLFETFDGLTYQYDICDHVLMRERTAHMYSVTVHKSCPPDSPHSCQRYLVVEQDGVVLKIGPGMEDITVQDNRVSSDNLWIVSQRFKDFELRKKGNAIVFRSKKYHFDVIWDSVQDVKIVLSRCLTNQVLGLCGLYNKDPSDDRTTHEGKLASNNEEFGNSWSIGPPERCEATTCPEDVMKRAIVTCQVLQDEPFSSCSGSLKMESRVESCIVFMCECLQRSLLDARKRSDTFNDIYDTGECKCLAYESFVEACEAVKPEPVPEWRIQYDCTPECPPGMEWQDCGPGCELTCDNYHDREAICNGSGCTAGCYCPAGLVRHHDRCVKPKMCQDCVCRGHGDPNYITFDGRYYAFQGNCTYVLAQHLTAEDENMNFKILATNVECPEEPHTSCTDGLQIFWNGHIIEKFKNKPVYFDGEALTKNDSPLQKNGISITFVPGKSTIVHIKSINLAVRYFDQMYGFNIELPAFYYYNKTEGLCGVCNFIQSDDLYHKDGYVTEDIEDFAYSWLVAPDRRDQCHMPRVIAPEPPPGICNFTISPCETFLDPTLYSESCQNDVTYSHKPEASMCRSKFQYAQQCCERGISLVDWLKVSGCEYACPSGMYFACTPACPKTCENYRDYRPSDCDLMPLYTCSCPAGKVLQLGSCVDEKTCETCDEFGHIIGDVWNISPCEVCECAKDLVTKCTVTQCPLPPLCGEFEKLQKVEGNASACCEVYQCVEIPAELRCPEAKLKNCAKGEANVIAHVDSCPVYHCECMPDLCPPLLEPILEEGEQFAVEIEGCCPSYNTKCFDELCSKPPTCKPGFRLSTQEGKCCLKYACIPKKNVCVYQYKYGVVNGTQISLAPEEYYEKEYETGSSWQDGLCRKCSCVQVKGQHAFSCREEICPTPDEFPDAEKYEREIIHVPGVCCPKYRRTACKVNGVPHSIDSEWPSPNGDNCKSYKCVMEKGEAAILEKTTVCDKTCPDYAIYMEPSPDSNKCCGECKPVACEENGILYEDGSTWISTMKPCYKAECSVTSNGTHIVYRGESCPIMPENCPLENVKTDPKGCCSYCKRSTDGCSAVQVPIYESRGFFGYVDQVKGFCSNEDALENLTKCAGQCATDSLYSNLIGDFESVCNCCVPISTHNRLVILDCADGSKVEKVYQQPSSCKCSNCSGRNDRSLTAMDQVEPV